MKGGGRGVQAERSGKWRRERRGKGREGERMKVGYVGGTGVRGWKGRGGRELGLGLAGEERGRERGQRMEGREVEGKREGKVKGEREMNTTCLFFSCMSCLQDWGNWRTNRKTARDID